MTKAFISYSHVDEKVVAKLHTHLAVLKRDGHVDTWHDSKILAGNNLDHSISKALESASLFLAIVSPDYLNSNYCYNEEFVRALELQNEGKLLIVPIIAEPCDWLSSPLSKMKAVPKDGKAISEWTNDNAAYLNVISELRRVVQAVNLPQPIINTGQNMTSIEKKNYRVARDFTKVDIINYQNESFLEIKKFFLESINEINTVDNIQAIVLNEGQKKFSCLVSNRSKIDANGYITVFIPTEHSFMAGANLSYVLADHYESNSIELNNIFSVTKDEYNLYWSRKDVFNYTSAKSFSVKEIAEYMWNVFISQVGISIS